MLHDLIVEEVRHHRDEYAKQFNYDLHAICEDLRKKQRESGHDFFSRLLHKPLLTDNDKVLGKLNNKS